MWQHLGYPGLGQAPDPTLVLVASGNLSHGDLRSNFEATLKQFQADLAAAKTPEQVEALRRSFAETALVYQRAGLWRTPQELAKDDARAQALVQSRLNALGGFLGLPLTTWLLIAVGVGAGWYFLKKSKGGMSAMRYNTMRGFCGIYGCK